MAKIQSSIFASVKYSIDLSHKLPNITTASPSSKSAQMPMLNEDTVPSAKPMKKKYKTTSVIRASKPHKIQKNVMLI